ncbi:MAG: hypothetical protein H6Q43_886 [Deltaproteobacteria bacterium]|nr:hypothetical protein [Deltaproteobacteria bacterium]
MKRLFSKVGVVGFIVTLVTISFCFTPLAAEKKKFSMTTKREKWVSENLLEAYGDRSQIRMDFQRYVIKQGVHLDIIPDSTEPDLIGAEQTVYWQGDHALGYPPNERGITITRTKEGHCLYSKWESTIKGQKWERANWEAESEIRFQFIGGTGKYSDLRGSGTCRGKRTPKEDRAKCEGEWEY